MKTLTLEYNKETGRYDLPMGEIVEMFDARYAKGAALAQDGGGEKSTEVAELEAPRDFLQKIVDFKVADIPLGAGVVGGTSAFLLANLADYLIAKTAKTNADGTKTPVVPLWAADLAMAAGAAFAAKKFKAAAPALNLAAMFLVYEAARNPIETQIDKILHPATAPAAQPPMRQEGGIMAQANAVAMRASDYYSRAEGRA